MNLLRKYQLKLCIISVLTLLLFFIGCWEFLSINQPDMADPNSTFEVSITEALTPEEGKGRGYFGIYLPIGWTVEENITFSGVLEGTFVYSSQLSDSMEIYDSPYRPEDGYYWWIGVSDSIYGLPKGNINVTPKITTDNQKGTFFINYLITDKIGEIGDMYSRAKLSGSYPVSVDAPLKITVDNTNDSGERSLRQAISKVSSSGEIIFDLVYPATIVLDSALVIDRNLTITGPKSEKLVLSGNNKSTVIYIGENLKNVNISNLIIKEGNKNNGSRGSGIYCVSSELNLKNVTFSNNIGYTGGGVSAREQSKLILNNVIFRENIASSRGGGISAYESDIFLTNVTMIGNKSLGQDTRTPDMGGAISIDGFSNYTASLFNVTIYGNSAVLGGAIGVLGNNLTLSLVNCILWENSPHEIFFVGDDDDSEISYSLITANSNIKNGKNGISANNRLSNFWLDGNINSNPLFTDPNNGDFNLKAGSPCIDAGIQDTIIIYNNSLDTLYILPMVYTGSAPDMGAYGGYLNEIPYKCELNTISNTFALFQNYPNPFNPKTVIRYALPVTSHLDLSIYNLLGQKVATLVDQNQPAGRYQVQWDAGSFASGVYFYRLRAGKDFIKIRKMCLIR